MGNTTLRISMSHAILDQAKAKMRAVIEHYKTELKTIRTGRAHAAMLDNISVEVYGAPMRLRDIASITAPEIRQLFITPFDRSNAPHIGKAIEKENLGFSVTADATGVRLTLPPMDKRVREEMVKVCRKKVEEAKVAVRNLRRDINKQVEQQKAAGEIPEDLLKKLEKETQDLTDSHCKELDELCRQKEVEVMQV